jgi:hypothetical protein
VHIIFTQYCIYLQWGSLEWRKVHEIVHRLSGNLFAVGCFEPTRRAVMWTALCLVQTE